MYSASSFLFCLKKNQFGVAITCLIYSTKMEVPQRRQQTCSSSCISTGSCSKVANKEDEGKLKGLETDFKSSGVAICLMDGKTREDGNSKTIHWCNPHAAPACF